jgi:hypothetical protein
VSERGLARPVFAVICIAVTAAGLMNVYGDNADVMKQAERLSCGGEDCAVTVTRVERGPISQSFTFQTRITERGKPASGSTVDVTCKRAFWFVGDYECRRDN